MKIIGSAWMWLLLGLQSVPSVSIVPPGIEGRRPRAIPVVVAVVVLVVAKVSKLHCLEQRWSRPISVYTFLLRVKIPCNRKGQGCQRVGLKVDLPVHTCQEIDAILKARYNKVSAESNKFVVCQNEKVLATAAADDMVAQQKAMLRIEKKQIEKLVADAVGNRPT